MNKTARINFVDNQIVCKLSECSITDTQRIEHSGFSVWKADKTIFAPRCETSLLILVVALNELNFKVQIL